MVLAMFAPHTGFCACGMAHTLARLRAPVKRAVRHGGNQEFKGLKV
jgi:hypothetical protein